MFFAESEGSPSPDRPLTASSEHYAEESYLEKGTFVPEPPADARPQAVARAREQYDRLMKSAGRAMIGVIRAAMEALVSHVPEG